MKKFVSGLLMGLVLTFVVLNFTNTYDFKVVNKTNNNEIVEFDFEEFKNDLNEGIELFDEDKGFLSDDVSDITGGRFA